MLLIIADASIEIVPKELQRERIVQLSAKKKEKKPSEILLDASLHWQTMAKLKEKEKRGRPDVVHDLLKLALDSQLCTDEKLEIIISTYNHEVIRVNPKTRIPRNYNQFVGLIEQLYEKKKIQTRDGDILLEITTEKIERFLAKDTLVFETEGKNLTLKKLEGKFEEKLPDAIVIGGYAHGELSEKFNKHEKITLFNGKETTSSAILSVVLTCLETSRGY